MHDQNFKNLMLDYPRQALAFFASNSHFGPDPKARARHSGRDRRKPVTGT